MKAHVASAALFTIIFIAGCAGNSPTTELKASENALLKAASAMQQRAANSYAAGDYSAALAGFEGAASVYESLALTEPAAQARLSAARVMAEDSSQGLEQALQTVQRVLADSRELSASTRITANGRMAALQLTKNDLPASSTALQAAQSLCAGSCTQAAALQVLRSRLQLAQGDAAGAVQSASAAVGDAAEQANALRARAQAQARLGQHTLVIADANAALELDRAAGQSARVIIDLQLLAAAHQALGQTEQAQRYESLAARATQALTAVQRGLP
jgi:tetratricopeptide (TPR) repeat protein